MKKLVVTALLLLSSLARGDDLMVRILADRASVHTGPGFSYRTIYTAERGEVLRAVERATRGYWFRVILPDGTYGWVLGDEVFPFEIDMGGKYHEPGIFARMGDALFAPSPLGDGVVEFTFSAGILGGDGMFLFRPAILLDPHVAIEAYFGETLGNQTDVLYYGAGANAYLWPGSPVTPFFALGGGGVSSRKKADQFTVRVGDFSTANAGGGMMFAFKKRVTLRFDFRNHIIFDPNHTNTAQEYSGGLAIVF